ncbi:MAG: type II secretion system protein GspM [Pseudomonadota bacterium]
MNFNRAMNRMAQSLSEFWAVRNVRERRYLLAAAAILLSALLYSLLIGPAITGIDQLNKALPALRQQVAQIRSLSQEAAGLTSQAPLSVVPMTRASLEASLARKGLKPQSVSLTGDVAQVQLGSVSFAGTIDWLDDVQKTGLISVAEAKVVALAQPDMVDVTVMLRQQKSE